MSNTPGDVTVELKISENEWKHSKSFDIVAKGFGEWHIRWKVYVAWKNLTNRQSIIRNHFIAIQRRVYRKKLNRCGNKTMRLRSWYRRYVISRWRRGDCQFKLWIQRVFIRKWQRMNTIFKLKRRQNEMCKQFSKYRYWREWKQFFVNNQLKCIQLNDYFNEFIHFKNKKIRKFYFMNMKLRLNHNYYRSILHYNRSILMKSIIHLRNSTRNRHSMHQSIIIKWNRNKLTISFHAWMNSIRKMYEIGNFTRNQLLKKCFMKQWYKKHEFHWRLGQMIEKQHEKVLCKYWKLWKLILIYRKFVLHNLFIKWMKLWKQNQNALIMNNRIIMKNNYYLWNRLFKYKILHRKHIAHYRMYLIGNCMRQFKHLLKCKRNSLKYYENVICIRMKRETVELWKSATKIMNHLRIIYCTINLQYKYSLYKWILNDGLYFNMIQHRIKQQIAIRFHMRIILKKWRMIYNNNLQISLIVNDICKLLIDKVYENENEYENNHIFMALNQYRKCKYVQILGRWKKFTRHNKDFKKFNIKRNWNVQNLIFSQWKLIENQNIKCKLMNSKRIWKQFMRKWMKSYETNQKFYEINQNSILILKQINMKQWFESFHKSLKLKDQLKSIDLYYEIHMKQLIMKYWKQIFNHQFNEQVFISTINKRKARRFFGLWQCLFTLKHNYLGNVSLHILTKYEYAMIQSHIYYTQCTRKKYINIFHNRLKQLKIDKCKSKFESWKLLIMKRKEFGKSIVEWTIASIMCGSSSSIQYYCKPFTISNGLPHWFKSSNHYKIIANTCFYPWRRYIRQIIQLRTFYKQFVKSLYGFRKFYIFNNWRLLRIAWKHDETRVKLLTIRLWNGRMKYIILPSKISKLIVRNALFHAISLWKLKTQLHRHCTLLLTKRRKRFIFQLFYFWRNKQISLCNQLKFIDSKTRNTLHSLFKLWKSQFQWRRQREIALIHNKRRLVDELRHVSYQRRIAQLFNEWRLRKRTFIEWYTMKRRIVKRDLKWSYIIVKRRIFHHWFNIWTMNMIQLEAHIARGKWPIDDHHHHHND